jgi:hypothetical protein
MLEKVSDIGEFGLIRRINDLVNRDGLRSERLSLGIGDDAVSFPDRDMNSWSPVIVW